jgi:predicted transcriptional regulator
MKTSVLTVADDRNVQELAEFLTTNEISGAVVVDAKGALVGVVSVTDIADDRSHATRNARVKDIMTPTVYTVPEDTTIVEAARTMIAGRIHRLFVTRSGRMVGIVTPLDLLELLVAG